MTRITATRDSIDDRFSVISFRVRAEQPLFEVGLATEPDLFRVENKARRTRSNFFASPLLGSAQPVGGESVYLVPPAVVARFVGQPRLYFGLATYGDSDRRRPVSVRTPDRGTMYVSLAGLTERGLRRTTRSEGSGDPGGYGSGSARTALEWGGDALAPAAQSPARGGQTAEAGNSGSPGNGSNAGRHDGATPGPDAATYSDGYPDDLWQPPAPGTAVRPVGAGSEPTQAPAATAQSVRQHNGDARRTLPTRHAGPARAMRVVGPYYRPSDPIDALRTQLGFFAASAQWLIGVDDTTVQPHSAICQARTVDGSADGGIHGSAFFIAPNLLLTAAHVVDGQSALIIVPGKNGAGTAAANEPFGRIRVGAADMAKHPSYAPDSRDFDLALIRVPAAQASPNYFGLVEELTQSRPEGVVVSGYAAYSDPADTVDRVVNALVDPDRQHMHGGYIRSLPSAETFDYDLQSLGGTSGSPVYYIEDGAAPRTHMVGVHVAGAGDTTNLGCRITPAKLAWIRTQAAAWGHALSFSLAARGLADDGEALAAGSGSGSDQDADEDTFACNPEPVEDEPASAAQGRALDARQPDYPGASRFVPAHRANFRSGRRRGATIDRIVIHITAGGPSIDGTIGWFQNPDHTNPRTGRNHPSSAHYIVGRDGEVVQMVGDADTAYHASSANARSIGIEHNANKPYRLNRRDLPPTDPQYEASAQLVAWLAARHGVPLDRQHIVGHAEASPGDNHDCPSAYWDWDRYMDCLHAAADALAQAGAASPTPSAPSTAQGVRRHGAPVRAQELITPYYDPSDPASALTCTADAFSASREEWYVGVEDTHAFPHAAICQLTMTDAEGRSARGTGFYIGRDRILTCAHNLHGMERVTVVPGRNGAGDAPHGQCTLPASSWRVASRYTGDGDWDNDLAVIDGVPIAAPGGRFFRFLQATPGESMPLAVCGYSTASRLVRELNPVFDGDRQHLHGGHAQGMPTADTIDYDILALAGASGSPVYTVRDTGDGPEALVCAVHVTRGPIAGGAGNGPSVNRGCFVTPAKIEWIEGRATAFAHRGARALAVDAIEHDVRLVPQPDKNACWAASMAMLLGFRGARSVDPEALAREVGGSLSTSYDWDLLRRVSAAHGFVVLEQPSNSSLYHAPTQWAAWLREFGPLWVVIVGAPHAVVLAGIRGELADPASVEVKVLNPWDTQTAFDATDPVRFDPPNQGHEGWLPFEQFAADFGEMAEPDYGNWRVLHLPASASVAAAQSLAARRDRRLAAPPKARMLSADAAASDAIDPPRVTGTRMRVDRGSAGATRWQLDQLEGRKPPATARENVGAQGSEVLVDLGAWPAIDGQPAPLPLTVAFRGHADGAVGDVAIRAGAPATLGYGVEVVARIDDHADIDGVAAVKVGIDVRFVGLVDGAPAARIDLTLLGDGRYQRTNRWLDATRAA